MRGESPLARTAYRSNDYVAQVIMKHGDVDLAVQEAPETNRRGEVSNSGADTDKVL